jgi:hypothetical protein
VRIIIVAAVMAAFLISAGQASARPRDAAPPPDVQVATSTTTGDPDPGAGYAWPSGCRDVDVYATQKSFLFGTTIYKFHQLKHWCWRSGAIYDERHAWSFQGSSTACLQTVYPANAWYYTWSAGLPKSGHYSEERAHVTNCVFHFGDWKEFYPDVKIWSYANGGYNVSVAN